MTPRLTWSHASGHDELRVDGLSEPEVARLRSLPIDALEHAMPVFASEMVDETGGGPAPVLTHRLTPMRGSYRVDATGVTFVPAHSLFRGRSYSALLGDDELRVCLPSAAGPPTRVVSIHPTAPVVPRNLLRCYVEFSAPMSEGDAASGIAVVDQRGTVLPGALLDMDPELWDARRTRLTVLFDPARIKRGLAPHREAGYPLREHEPVELVVSSAMRDARGLALGADARRRYRVGPDVRSLVAPPTWRVDPVAAGTTGVLRVAFARPLDHALLAHCLRVVDARGNTVAGNAAGIATDTAWSFVPERPWRAVRYRLVVDPVLEDVCGNSVTRVFDRDVADPAHARGPDRPVVVPFLPC